MARTSTSRDAAIHQAGYFWLYEIDGHPVVIKRWMSRRKDAHGAWVQEPREERIGDLEQRAEAINPDPRAELQKAWREWLSWNNAMRPQG